MKAELQKLYPEATPEELATIEANLEAYLRVVVEVYRELQSRSDVQEEEHAFTVPVRARKV